MKLQPVPQSALESLAPFFEPIIPEMGLSDRIDIKDWIASLEVGYVGRYTDVYVDDLANPSHCLVLCRTLGGVDRGVITTVRLIYSKPDVRTKENTDALLEVIENYAKIHGCSIILASSWKFKGSRPIDSLWLDQGFEIQETTYVKKL